MVQIGFLTPAFSFRKTKVIHKTNVYFLLKGTVSVISSEPPFKDGNVQFTTIPLKLFLINYVGYVSCL